MINQESFICHYNFDTQHANKSPYLKCCVQKHPKKKTTFTTDIYQKKYWIL